MQLRDPITKGISQKKSYMTLKVDLFYFTDPTTEEVAEIVQKMVK